MKTVTSPKLSKAQCNFKDLSSSGEPKQFQFFMFFVCNVGSCFETHQDAPKTLLGRSRDPSRRPRAPLGFGLGGNLGVTWSILGLNTNPKTRPRHSKKRDQWFKNQILCARAAQERFKAPPGRWGTPVGFDFCVFCLLNLFCLPLLGLILA